MSQPIKFISVNIEQQHHLSEVRNFLAEQQADIVCFQEVLQRDLLPFEQEFNYQSVFAPMHDLSSDSLDRKGVAVLFRGQLSQRQLIYYGGFVPGERPKNPATIVPDHCVLLAADLSIDGTRYSVATTHFTWSFGGQVIEAQQQNLARLLANLEPYNELILCGDFNSPRGSEIFDTLAHKFRDNVPTEVTSTIDGSLHRAGELPFVVDGLFTTDHYQATEVGVLRGVSDHCAIVATIERAS